MAASLTAKAGGTQGALQVNGTDAVVFDATGITSGGNNIQLAVQNTMIGYNQTWQNMTASRAFGTTYTNSTTKPIMVMVTATGVANVSYTQINATVGFLIGVSVSTNNGSATNPCISFIVPPGALYSCTVGNGSLAIWAELR